MKLLIASDIHGSEAYCKILFDRIYDECPDKIVLLGDLLYHGPRNNLPLGYYPKGVIALLNSLTPAPLCVRGNCEAEVDSMVLNFPVSADYAYFFIDGISIFASHGHLFSEENPPSLSKGEILLTGHTHVPKVEEHENFTYINCGSVSIPKEGSPHSYMTLENGVFKWKNLTDGAVYNEYDASLTSPRL